MHPFPIMLMLTINPIDKSRKYAKSHGHTLRILDIKIGFMMTVMSATPAKEPALATVIHNALEHHREIFTTGRTS